jgi:methyl-accepting chemotaxis protein
MNDQANPDERFEEVHTILNKLSDSHRNLLTAQVLMHDRLSRSEKLVEQLAEQAVQTNQHLDRLTEKVDSIADSLKHTDSNVEALTETVRQLIERNGSGAGQQPA